jgi:hypothetical protein
MTDKQISQLKHRRFVGLAAAASGASLTLLTLLSNATIPIIRMGSAVGVFLASLPFGGLHNNPPTAPLVIFAAVINAALWGGVAFGLWSLMQDLRIARASR